MHTAPLPTPCTFISSPALCLALCPALSSPSAALCPAPMPCRMLPCDAGALTPLLHAFQWLGDLGAHEVIDGDTVFLYNQASVTEIEWQNCPIIVSLLASGCIPFVPAYGSG